MKQAVYNVMCKRCASGDRDHIAVLLLNTEKKSNELGFEHLFLLIPPAMPGAEEVKRVDAFRGKGKLRRLESQHLLFLCFADHL